MARIAKKRNDSVEGAMALVDAANTAIQPIDKLSKRAMQYFEGYIQTRPSFSWSQGDVIRLTRLSERMAEVDLLTKAIQEEGHVTVNPRGTPIPNPLIAARDSMERMCMAAERSLSVYAPMQGSNKQNTFDQAQEVNEIKKGGKHDLLA